MFAQTLDVMLSSPTNNAPAKKVHSINSRSTEERFENLDLATLTMIKSAFGVFLNSKMNIKTFNSYRTHRHNMEKGIYPSVGKMIEILTLNGIIEVNFNKDRLQEFAAYI